MDYDALIRDLRSSAKAFRENSVYDSEGDPIRLIVQADEADRAAAAIADLRARNEALVKVIARSTEGWENAVELGLIPPQHRNTATILADEGRAALAANREG